jgi:hypothetical protein
MYIIYNSGITFNHNETSDWTVNDHSDRKTDCEFMFVMGRSDILGNQFPNIFKYQVFAYHKP